MDRFLIAPLNTGLETDLRPWQIPDDAFAKLFNAYVFRGRVRKRWGSIGSGNGTYDSRFGIKLGTTDGSGNLSGTVPGIIWKIGQLFSIGNVLYTVYQTTGAMYATTATTTATFDTTSGAYVFAGAPLTTDVYYYPSQPVMGLTQYESGLIDTYPSYGFDTQFAYTLKVPGKWVRSSTGAGAAAIPVFHGTNSQFFWSYNIQSQTSNDVAIITSNFNVNTAGTSLGLATDDPIYTMTKVSGVDTWAPYSYLPNSTTNPTNIQPLTVTTTLGGSPTVIANYIQSALIIVQFKNRLLMLNTIENNNNAGSATTPITPTNYLTSTNSNYFNRCRFSALSSPYAVNAWLEKNQSYQISATTYLSAGAGFIDASTEEAIISAEFIKDRLIVYFEDSTWEIAYTGNEVEPFVFQKLNTELGSHGTFSTIPFDKAILNIGPTGIQACNGANVQRIDDKIPDYVFGIRGDQQATSRIAGIRDYQTELAYWSFPVPGTSINYTHVYPNQIIVYNYKNNSWAIFDDTLTTFGYVDIPSIGSFATPNRQIIAGNQQGYVALIGADISTNAEGMSLINAATSGPNVVLTIIDHNLEVGDYVSINNMDPASGLNDKIFAVVSIADANTVSIGPAAFSGVYTGGGMVARSSQMFIQSKQWNPYVSDGTNVYVSKINFCVLATTSGQVQVDYSPSSTNLSMVADAAATGAILGNEVLPFSASDGGPVTVYGVLETSPYPTVPLEAFQTRLWHPVYLQTQGEFIQIMITLTDAQMRTPTISESDFQLEGLVLYTDRTSSRLQ